MVLAHKSVDNFCNGIRSKHAFDALISKVRVLIILASKEALRQKKGDKSAVLQIMYLADNLKSKRLTGNTIKYLYEQIYNKGYAPPNWTYTEYTDLLRRYGSSAFVIAPSNAIPQDIIELVNRRQPVNIATMELFDRKRMLAKFGYIRSAYTDIWLRNNSLPPNIGVYTHTPVHPYGKEKFKSFDAHVYNAIGYGFDSDEQPDYIELEISDNLNINLLRTLVGEMIERIYLCASMVTSVTTIAMSLVGCGAFSSLAPISMRDDVFVPMFLEINEKMNNDYDIVFLGNYAPSGFKSVGFIPQCFKNLKDIENILFVNAWDPHSIPGNGNGNDNSLDGQFGRRTAIGLLGWGLSNPSLANDIRFI